MIIEIEGNSSAFDRHQYKSIYYIEIDNIIMVEKRVLDTIAGVNRYEYSLHVGSKTISGIDPKDAERVLSLKRAIERSKQIDSILE